MTKASQPRFKRQTADARRQSLIDAAVHCLSQGGIAAFTIDNISREAQVSRGLINHHFKGIEDLLAEVYASMTKSMQTVGRAALHVDGGAEQRLTHVIDTMFVPPMFSKASLRAWLALWGEIAVNPKLRKAHRESYDSYRRAMTEAIDEIAKARRINIDSHQLAIVCIALIDGLWIEWCLDSSVVTRESAKIALYGVLEAKLGRLQP